MADRITVRALAKLIGLSNATTARRVSDLVAAGKLTCEPGPGKSKLIDPEEYRRVAEANVDGLKQHAAQAHRAAKAGASDKVTPIDSHLGELADLRREQERMRGELLGMTLALRTGKACRSEDLERAIGRIATAAISDLDALFATKLDDLVEAHRKGGVRGVRKWLEDCAETIALKVDVIAEAEIDRLLKPATMQ